MYNKKYATDLLCLILYSLTDPRYNNNSFGPSVETLI